MPSMITAAIVLPPVLKAFLQRFLIIEGQEDHIIGFVYRRHDGRVVGDGAPQRCLP